MTRKKVDTALISALLSNVFEGLQAPVIINIGFIGMKQMLEKKLTPVGIANELRQNGIDAVPFFVPEAKDPSKTVVSCTGVQTPFVCAAEARQTAARFLTILERMGVSCNMPFPVMAAQLYLPGKSGVLKTDRFRKLTTTLLKEAYQKSADNNVNELNTLQELTGHSCVFRGASLGGNPYGVVAARENKAVAYAAPNVLNAVSFCTGALMKTSFFCDNLQSRYGFLYEYAAAADQKHYDDWELEEMASLRLHKNPKEPLVCEIPYETPIFPHRNPLKNIYIALSDSRVYRIPREDPRWQEFLQGHKVRDTTIFGFLAERRVAHLKELIQQKRRYPRVYHLLNTTSLTPLPFHDQSHRDSLEFFRGVYGFDALVCDEGGQLYWTYKKPGSLAQPLMWDGEDLKLAGIQKFPKGSCVIDYDRFQRPLDAQEQSRNDDNVSETWSEIQRWKNELQTAVSELDTSLKKILDTSLISEDIFAIKGGELIGGTEAMLPLDILKKKIIGKKTVRPLQTQHTRV